MRTEKAAKNHLLNQKSERQKKLGLHPQEVAAGEVKRVKKLMPHVW